MLAEDSIRNQLRGLNFPAGRTQIIEWAIQTGAAPELISALHRLPELSYGSLADVIHDLKPLLPQAEDNEPPSENQIAA